MIELYLSGKYLTDTGSLNVSAIMPKVKKQLHKKMKVVACRYAHTGIRLTSTYHKLAYLASLYFPEMEGQTLTFTDTVLTEFESQGNLAAKAFKLIADAYAIQFTLEVKALSSVEDMDYLEGMLATKSSDELLGFLLDSSSWIELGDGYVEGQAIMEYAGTSPGTADTATPKPYFEYLQTPAPRTLPIITLLGDWQGGGLYSRFGKPLENVLTPEELDQLHKEAIVVQITVATKISTDTLPSLRVLPYIVCKQKQLHCTSNVKVYRRNFPADMEITVKVPKALHPKLWYNTGIEDKEVRL